jgi:hypothetical protein
MRDTCVCLAASFGFQKVHVRAALGGVNLLWTLPGKKATRSALLCSKLPVRRERRLCTEFYFSAFYCADV